MNLNIFELDELLMQVEGIFDGWHSDGTAWSDYDETIRQKLLDFRTKYTYRTQGQKWQEMVKAGKVSEDTVPLRHYAQICEIADKKNQKILALQKQLQDLNNHMDEWKKDWLREADERSVQHKQSLAKIEELEFKLNNAEHYAAKKELEYLRLSQERGAAE
jgi:predicted phage tail protein